MSKPEFINGKEKIHLSPKESELQILTEQEQKLENQDLTEVGRSPVRGLTLRHILYDLVRKLNA